MANHRSLREAIYSHPLPRLSQKKISKAVLIWTFVCCLSAAPSYVIAMGMREELAHQFAMLTGIAIFIAMYSTISCMPFFRRLYRIQIFNQTFKIGYATRVGITIIFPIGMFLDMFCGLISGMFINTGNYVVRNAAAAPEMEALYVYLNSLAWTIMQGIVLNLVLLVYMLCVYGFLWLAYRGEFKTDSDDLTCSKCNYDLRGSLENCPECGQVIPTQIMLRIKRLHEKENVSLEPT